MRHQTDHNDLINIQKNIQVQTYQHTEAPP